VFRATDGVAALELAERCQPDVALLDIGMPRMDGYELARNIRAEPWGAQMKLIALTGWGQESDRRRSRDSGFDGHLTKPVDQHLLDRLLSDARALAVTE
jgi:CheY-like chemotaxis protein